MRNNGTRVGAAEDAGKSKAASVTEAEPAAGTVEITGSGHVLVKHLLIDRRPVAEYLQRAESADWPRLLVEALEIGVHCLEHASQAHGLDFVRQQAQEVAREMAGLPALIELEFRKQVSAKDGVLAPIVGAVGTTEKLLKEKLLAVQTLLDKEIDPRRPDTTLGKALATIASLLDEKRDDSLPRKLTQAIESVAIEDGQLITTLMKALVVLVKPLQDELANLRKEVHQRQGADEALNSSS